MTDYKALCAEVFAYHEGQDKYDFSHLNPYDRENAAFDAWQEIKAELKHALAQPEPEGPTDAELLELTDDWPATTGPRHDLSGCPEVPLYSVFADEVIEFARAVLARWGCPVAEESSVAQSAPF
jgi:hypothetical protein